MISKSFLDASKAFCVFSVIREILLDQYDVVFHSSLCAKVSQRYSPKLQLVHFIDRTGLEYPESSCIVVLVAAEDHEYTYVSAKSNSQPFALQKKREESENEPPASGK